MYNYKKAKYYRTEKNMYKTELRSFFVKTESSPAEISVPCSLLSVADAVNVSGSDGTIEISVSFDLSTEAARLKFAFFEVPDLEAPADIVFNGNAEFQISGGRRHKLDVSGFTRIGENTLVIKVNAGEDAQSFVLIEEIRFLAFNHAHISDITARPIFISNAVSVEVTLDLIGDARDVKAVATLVSPSGKIYYGGITNGRAVINVPDPLLWWPGNYGVHNLYKLSVNLYYDSEVIDSVDTKIGLRSAFLDDRTGAAFTVNGMPLLALGTEYVQGGKDSFITARTHTDELLSLAVGANMNFLRYRGEGHYPCEDFLFKCDALGIMLEFVIKSKKLERGDEDAFRRELVYNVKRLSRHPSVISIAYEDSHLASKYEELLVETRTLVSSTILVRKLSTSDVLFASRSLPDIKTLADELEPSSMNIFSHEFEGSVRDSSLSREMLDACSSKYKYASDMNELTYMTGLVQAHAAEDAARGVRRERSSVGSCVIGTLNDYDLAISASFADHHFRTKPVYDLATRFFAPISAFVTENSGKIAFILSNETRNAFDGTLEYGILDNENRVIFKNSLAVSMDKLSSGAVAEEDFSELLCGKERELYLSYSLIGERGAVASSTHLFTPPKYFSFKDTDVTASVSGIGNSFTLTYSAGAFVKDVIFSFDGTDAKFEENCIDIKGPVASTLRFTTAEPKDAGSLDSELVIRTVADIGRCR